MKKTFLKIKKLIKKNLKYSVLIFLLASMSLLEACSFKNPMAYFKSVDEKEMANQEEDTSQSAEETTETESQSKQNKSVLNTNETEANKKDNSNETINENKEAQDLLVYTIGNDSAAKPDSCSINNKAYKINYENYEIKSANALETKDFLEINKNLSDKINSVDNILIITSPQTAEELSYFLSLTFKSDKKIAVVGANLSDNSYDITDDNINNLFTNLKASNLENNVLVTTKDFSLTNASVNVSDDKKIDVSNLKDLSYISIVYDYTGNDGTVLENAISKSDGVILVTTNDSGDLSEAAGEIVNSNYSSVPVVIISINSNNNTTTNYHTPTQARILLSLALKNANDIDGIKDYFTTY